MSEQIIKKWTEAFKNEDWETVASLYSDDTVGSDPTGATFTGREANLANDKIWRNIFSDFNFEFGVFIQSGNTGAVEMQVTATMTGEMEMPDGSKIPPTGKTHTMRACQIIESENGQIKNQRMYTDMMSMMAGFGVMPS
jgi:steroid delta-isomerase-like uncharacterized protein